MPLSFEAFTEALRDDEGRRQLLFRGDRLRFVLMSQQFDRAHLDHLCDVATAVRRLDRHVEGRGFLRSILEGKRVMCLFAQPSTRTAESFVAAAEKLGATARVVSDLSTSSFAKGESVEDAVRVLSSFYDVLVTRHPEDTFAERAAWALWRSQRTIPVISGGSGKSHHPTQALLDIYTLRYSMQERGGLDGKRVLVVGDVGRNRAARSLIYLLTRYAIDRVDLACVPSHRPETPFLHFLERHGVTPVFHDSLDAAIAAAGPEFDAIYMTRLQQEWDAGAAGELGTHPDFVLHARYREALRPDCALLHPLPRVNELPDAWEDHPGFVVWRQVRNGMWMRAALLAAVHGADGEIVDRAARLGLL